MRIYNIQNFISQLESEGRSKGTIEKLSLIHI